MLVAFAVSLPAVAQVAVPADSKCQPVAQRTGSGGCWILADHPVGTLLPATTFWQLDSYGSRAEAEAAKGTRGTVVSALQRSWVLEVTADGTHGSHQAAIGPLPVKGGVAYSAMYMETTSPPGFQSAIHTHAGPEAWLNLAGGMCLETPEGVIRDQAGSHGVFVKGDIPMLLTSTGSVERRAMVLVLHETSRPPITIEHQWAPKGLCR
jgi:hypothetical protein